MEAHQYGQRVISIFWALILCILPNNQAMAVQSLPPLVAEGEKIENIETLLKYINRQSLVLSVAFSPDGTTLASGAADNTIRLWDVASGQERRRLEGHTSQGVHSRDVTPESVLLQAASSQW